jgi:hypothetical protein
MIITLEVGQGGVRFRVPTTPKCKKLANIGGNLNVLGVLNYCDTFKIL